MIDIDKAVANLDSLAKNNYPGRLLIAGLDETAKYLVQLYAIMGRSPSSRNRVFVNGTNKGEIKTGAARPDELTNPELLIYPAMMEGSYVYAVSNGVQTADALMCDDGLMDEHFLNKYQYEPDEPIFTPRITSTFNLIDEIELELLILKKDLDSDKCIHDFFKFSEIELVPGYGLCLSTYQCDGNPPPHFEGEPYCLPLKGSQEEILETYWHVLNEDNKVSLAVKFIDIYSYKSNTLLKNKYKAVLDEKIFS